MSSSVNSSVLAAKDIPVLWGVSNCVTHSKREAFVAQLRRHANVSTVGACSKDREPLGCPRSGRPRPPSSPGTRVGS